MHIFPFPISRRSVSRKRYGSDGRSGSRKSHRNHLSEWQPQLQPQPVEESPQFECGEMPEWILNNLPSFIPPSYARVVRYDMDRGYDRDKVTRQYSPVPLSDYRDVKIMGEKLDAQVDFLIQLINSQMLGERYELDKLVKVVEKRGARSTLITFTVKEVSHNPNVVRTAQAMVFTPARFCFELLEWGFKDEEEESHYIVT